MKGPLAMLKRLFALVIFAAGPNAALAANVALEDILGRWCVSGSGNFNTFTRAQLLVQFPNGQNKALKIARVEVNENTIKVYWAYPYVSTAYELSDDKRTLVQLPNVDETGKPIGDKGPSRELHRC
jgi:hypothetical protein